MKINYKSFTNNYLKNVLRQTINTFHYTQEQLSEQMRITPRQFSNLINGKSGFGAVSLLCFLAFLPEEYVLTVLHKYRNLIEKNEEDETVTHRKKN